MMVSTVDSKFESISIVPINLNYTFTSKVDSECYYINSLSKFIQHEALAVSIYTIQ